MRWILLAAAVLVAGCASITRGHQNQVQFSSDPPGAQARTSMGHTCVTPCTLQFSRKDEFSVVFSKPGYETREVAVRTQLAGEGAAGFAGNVLIGGVVGMAVDAASGATNEHCPNPVAVTLRRLDAGGRPMGPAIAPNAHCQKAATPATPEQAAQRADPTNVQ
jgi:hypothetical protein